LDEIAKEKQRVSEVLARIDAQREKLSGQLSELEAAERVLARYRTDTQAKRTASRKTPTTAAEGVAQAQSGGRRRTRPAKSARVDGLQDVRCRPSYFTAIAINWSTR
jgi:chromosome segregation ATPase